MRKRVYEDNIKNDIYSGIMYIYIYIYIYIDINKFVRTLVVSLFLALSSKLIAKEGIEARRAGSEGAHSCFA